MIDYERFLESFDIVDLEEDVPLEGSDEPGIGALRGELTEEESWDDLRATDVDGLFDRSGDEFTPDDEPER